MRNGIRPNSFHFKDYSFERTFGSNLIGLPEEYNADLGLGFPDQNKDGYPNGCSGYTQTETGQDEYGKQFDPSFVYKNTLDIAGLPDGSPVKVRDSFKATRIYGLKPAQGDPLDFRRGNYFDVDKVGDYFDGARNALWSNRLHKRTLSCGTPWFSEWYMPKNGILRAPKKYVWDSNTIGHNYKICGWKVVNKEPMLIVKPWCGPKWGDKGYAYINREIFNKVMSISGTFLYVQVNFTPDQVQTVKLDIQEFILTLSRRLLDLLMNPKPPARLPVEPPISPVVKSRREKLYEYSVSKIGAKLGLDKTVPVDRNCANAYTHLLKMFGVSGLPVLGIPGTATLKDWLDRSKEFEKVSTPAEGDTVLWVTGSGNGKISGHVFIAGKQKWMSNNSAKDRIWDDHWEPAKATEYYKGYGGMTPHYYRIKD